MQNVKTIISTMGFNWTNIAMGRGPANKILSVDTDIEASARYVFERFVRDMGLVVTTWTEMGKEGDFGEGWRTFRTEIGTGKAFMVYARIARDEEA